MPRTGERRSDARWSRWRLGTPEPFLDAGGRRLPGSIAGRDSVLVDGVRLSMVIRGKDVTNPVLLWVHGGPGMPDYPLTQRYPTGLEDLFTLVWWDQRGAGLSYDARIPPQTMTVEQMVADTLAVTDHLRRRFDQDRIYLLGHSWGSFLALQAAVRSPERYAAYLGMAQMVHQVESEMIAYHHMLSAYRERGDRAMVRRLEAAPVTLVGGTPDGYLKVRDAAMHRLGIGTTRAMRSVITGIFLPSWSFRGYTLRERLDLWRGRAFSRRFDWWDQFLRVDVRAAVPALDLPVYLFEGAHDHTCVTSLAVDYLQQLDAPVKALYLFADSAHSPLLEEPAKAHRIMAQDVLTGRTALADLT